MRRFSSRPLGQPDGQDDLTIRLLLLRLRLDTRTADELEAVIHAVQEQPHVPHDGLRMPRFGGSCAFFFAR